MEARALQPFRADPARAFCLFGDHRADRVVVVTPIIFHGCRCHSWPNMTGVALISFLALLDWILMPYWGPHDGCGRTVVRSPRSAATGRGAGAAQEGKTMTSPYPQYPQYGSDPPPQPPPARRGRSVAFAVVGVLGGVVAGAVIASTVSANAASSSSTSQPSAGYAASSTMPAHGSAAHEAAEKPVTGAAATKAQAAAVKAAGGGTAGAVTTDFTGSGYEVTVTKSDGSSVEIHLDSCFTALQGGPGR